MSDSITMLHGCYKLKSGATHAMRNRVGDQISVSFPGISYRFETTAILRPDMLTVVPNGAAWSINITVTPRICYAWSWATTATPKTFPTRKSPTGRTPLPPPLQNASRSLPVEVRLPERSIESRFQLVVHA